MPAFLQDQLIQHATWPSRIPEDQWAVYHRVLQELRATNVDFAVGGGFATISYTGQWRNTKDLDIYVVPEQRDAAVQALTRAGLTDLYDEKPYDRLWIYRGHTGDIIVDVIWAMANHYVQVDSDWLHRGAELEVNGDRFRLVPPEETLWAKLYVVQRDRTDWGDALNILYAVGPELDWPHLIKRLGVDAPLLGALLTMFSWLCPDRAEQLPSWLWGTLHAWTPDPDSCLEVASARAYRLDSRPWFAPTLKTPAELTQ